MARAKYQAEGADGQLPKIQSGSLLPSRPGSFLCSAEGFPGKILMEFMLDTNTCIYIIKRTPPDVIKRFKRTEISQIGISSITLSELLYGVSISSRPEQNRMALIQFIAPLEILPYGDEAAQCYGDLRARLEKQGTPMGSLDMLIAAHALSIPCTLVTNNKKEFGRIPNLKIDDWVKT